MSKSILNSLITIPMSRSCDASDLATKEQAAEEAKMHMIIHTPAKEITWENSGNRIVMNLDDRYEVTMVYGSIGDKGYLRIVKFKAI